MSDSASKKDGSTAGASLLWYFGQEKKYLALTTVTGLVYNVGMTAGPWFEGQLAQYLYDILQGSRQARDIVLLSIAYVVVIGLVQGARALKRLYVRKFANDVSRSMKMGVYRHLVHESYAETQREDAGALMTRAISDAEACAEGMRKFTTEIFDTGVVMIAYLVMLFVLDWRLTLIVIVFPPVAYVASAALKKKVSSTVSASRKAMSRLNDVAVDAASNALTYRVYGEEKNRAHAYESVLSDYERKNVAAGVWQNSPQPIYLVISMIGVMPILYFGGANVLGHGWIPWSIATFSSFLSCFTKLATKSSHAANLFNALQKAQVSWQRIKGYLAPTGTDSSTTGVADGAAKPAVLEMHNVRFAYENAPSLESKQPHEYHHEKTSATDGAVFSLCDLNLVAQPGEIVGIAGQVASGKSTLGKLFLGERPYEGVITFGGRDIREIERPVFAYMGHDPELFTGTVRENIAFAEKGAADETRLQQVLSEAQLTGEVSPDSLVGMEGGGLSGGQQSRIALARALYSSAPVLILDDPFASVDANTELAIFRALRKYEHNRVILIISHRLALFPLMDGVALLENGTLEQGTHEQLMGNASYRALYELQCGEGDLDA